MYKDVIVSEETISANEVIINGKSKRERATIIDRSVCHLYQENSMEIGTRYLRALRFHDRDVFRKVENLFTGCASVSDVTVLSKVYIRYGWLDKTLNSLHWVSILDFYKMMMDGKAVGTHKGKLQYICTVLGLSRKKITYMDPSIYAKLISDAKAQAEFSSSFLDTTLSDGVRNRAH